MSFWRAELLKVVAQLKELKFKLAGHVSIKDFGAVGDGVTDDTKSIQAALDAIKARGGGTLHVPKPDTYYKITDGLRYDLSASVARFVGRLWIKGDGSATSIIKMEGVAATALSIQGNLTYELYLKIEGLQITGGTGSPTAGSTGLAMSNGGWSHLDDVIIEAFDYNLDCEDIEQSQMENCNFRRGNHGFRFVTGSATSPNSLLFTNCLIAGNLVWGWQITNANAVTFVGGSTQYNGTTGGGATQWGGKITEAGNGYGNVLLLGHIFEGNGGVSDFVSEQSTFVGVYTFIGVGFARPNNTSCATNFIKIDGSTASTYSLSGCTFRGYNTYAPNAARPYIANNNTSAIISDDGTNIYGSSTEWPSWAGSALIGTKAIGGAAVGSSLSLQSTSGVGTTDFIDFLVGNNGATRAGRFTTSGAYLVGSTLAPTTVAAGAVTPVHQIHGTASAGQTGSLGIFNWSAGAANILTARSKGGTVGTRGIVAANDAISAYVFYGDDGTNFIAAAEIRGLVDGTPGTNDMPGRLVFSTTADGAAAVTERLRIDNAGVVSHRANAQVIVDANSHLQLRSYTVAGVPSAATAGQLIYVSNGTANKRLAVSDGTNWRWPDGAIVS